jgi:hypothetical protein
MKKTIAFVCMALISIVLSAQTSNTLPNSGDVGIGTTNPTTKLQVCGTAKFDSTVIIEDTLKVSKDLIINENIIVNGDMNLKSQQGTGFDLLWIDQDGKIIRGGSQSLGGELLDEIYNVDCVQNPDGSYINPGWHNRTGVIYTDENCPPDVKVGITTRYPEARVHIVEKTTTDDILKLSTLTEGDIMVVENDGRVGIGTNTPTAHLHVYGAAGTGNFVRFENTDGTQFRVNNAGHVFCREVKVSLNNIADYVYDEDYKLMPIEEYKNFTETNKHLPGIPSQAEVEQAGGIEIGDFQVKLLEKIEEMSLYLFELNEKVKKLEKENEELHKKNSELENKIMDCKN